jgi:bifunctional non-homologous end joining protein LigD
VPHTTPFIRPCEPTLRDRLPQGEGWIYEVKFDGYWLQIHKVDGAITLYTRNGADWTRHFPHVVASLRSLPCRSAIIDAELVHVDGFDALHRQVHKHAEESFAVWAFDLMQLSGDDLRLVSLLDRKRRLGHLIERTGISHLYYSEPFTSGLGLLAECEERGLEGVVAKHTNSVYRSGPSTSWIKVKTASWREANKNRHELFNKPSGESDRPAWPITLRF